jgi:hypothetical protein
VRINQPFFYNSDVPFATEGELFLNQDGILLEIDENCTIYKHRIYCLETNKNGDVFAMFAASTFNAEAYILLPCECNFYFLFLSNSK